MFQSLEQCKAYLSASVYRNLLGYVDPQWEPVLFLDDTVSMVVAYKAAGKLELDYQISIPINIKGNYFHITV